MMSSAAFTSLMWFGVIIVMIPVALWLLRRTPAGAMLSGAGANALMRSVSALPLSANQRIVTVEVGQGDARCWLVLGVTPNSITTLHTMAPQAEAPGRPNVAGGAAAPVFSQMLNKLRQGKGSGDAR